MGFSSGNGRGRQTFNEINITPLTDVFLVLLVIMFLIAPLLDDQAALKVNPPSAKTASAQDNQQKKSIFIEISDNGSIAIDGEVVAEQSVDDDSVQELVFKKIDEIVQPLRAENPEFEKPVVKLKADKKVDYGRVIPVLAAVNEADLGNLSLVTVPLEDK